MTISESLFKALCLKFESEIAQSIVTLEIYFNNSVGIGEHPQHLEEMDKLIEQIASNEDKLSCLKKNFTKYSSNTASNVSINGNISMN
jgi:hypothetical protein